MLNLASLELQMVYCTFMKALGNQRVQSFSTVFLVRVIVSNILLFS